MHGADPHVGTNREITPSMATTDIFLGIYLKQAEKAYSIIKFIYEFKKQKQKQKKKREGYATNVTKKKKRRSVKHYRGPPL